MKESLSDREKNQLRDLVKLLLHELRGDMDE